MIKLSQRDDRWKNITLGTKGTIGDYGCLITCIAMIYETTPVEINNYLLKNNGYSDGNLVIWTKLPGFEWRGWTYEDDKVKDTIKKYDCCIVEVDWDGSPKTAGSHFVLFIGNQRMYDPWTGNEVSTSKYPLLKGYAIINPNKGGNMPSQDDTIPVKKTDFERMVREGSLYKEFVSAGYGSATEVKQLEADLRKSIDDKQSALNSEKEKSERLRKDFNDLVAMVAVSLGTVQEVPQIKVKLDEVQKELDQYDDLQRSFAELEVEAGKEKEELNAVIAHYKALLEQKDVLAEAKIEELVKELIKRLLNILKRR